MMKQTYCEEHKEYDFSELSEDAKQKAREHHTSDGYPYDDWWDGVYDDANRVAKILGLDIELTRQTKSGGTVAVVNISFSGFWRQGDGASFEGSYRYNPQAIAEMNEYCNDDELIRIATELTVMQTTQRLKSLDFFAATIRQSGRYSHSYTMDFEIHDYGIDEIGEPDKTQFAQLMRDFADWIYKTLETEHDYLMSDKVVDEQLADEKFDEDGDVI